MLASSDSIHTFCVVKSPMLVDCFQNVAEHGSDEAIPHWTPTLLFHMPGELIPLEPEYYGTELLRLVNGIVCILAQGNVNNHNDMAGLI